MIAPVFLAGHGLADELLCLAIVVALHGNRGGALNVLAQRRQFLQPGDFLLRLVEAVGRRQQKTSLRVISLPCMPSSIALR